MKALRQSKLLSVGESEVSMTPKAELARSLLCAKNCATAIVNLKEFAVSFGV